MEEEKIEEEIEGVESVESVDIDFKSQLEQKNKEIDDLKKELESCKNLKTELDEV